MASRKALKLAAKYTQDVLAKEWQPTIPTEFLKWAFRERVAFRPEDNSQLDLARDSVTVFIPKILDLLKKHQGEKYGVTGSESHGRLFYFFTDKHRLDSFNMTIAIKNEKAQISFGFTPYKLNGSPDFENMITKQNTIDPEVAGLGMMRLVRYVLNGIDYLETSR
jgi:hypothetical protein